jgi:hypothetical protein
MLLHAAALTWILTTSAPAAPTWRVLLDLRTHKATRQDVPAAQAERILARVFPGPDRVKSADKCEDGKFHPTIVTHARGSFTAPKRAQVVYLINDGWCATIGRMTTGSVAVFEGGQLVATAHAGASIFLEKLVDLDGDGTQELLLSSYESRFAETTAVCLVTLAGARVTDSETGELAEIAEIKDFGEVLVRDCDPDLEPGLRAGRGPAIEAHILYYVPAVKGGMPVEYHAEAYSGPCHARGLEDFKRISP